ncbi:MAG: 6-bladed beta-propeller, partial [bacterium]
MDEEYDQGRVVGFEVLDDGRMVIADGVSNQIRIYSPSGQRLATLGGRGEGPGEFVGLSGLLVRADSLIVLDEAVQRLTVLHLEGEVLRTARIAGAPRALGALIPISSGRHIGIERGGTRPSEPEEIV